MRSLPTRLLDSMFIAAALAVAASAQADPPAFDLLAQAAASETAAAENYGAPRIIRPKDGETVHDNTGAVPVEVGLQPPLNTKAGHRIRVMLDGARLAGAWSTSRFSLQQVDRGAHTLRVIVTDGEGKELARSDPIEFHMWQASRLFRGQRSKP
jgi:hypothetical protein